MKKSADIPKARLLRPGSPESIAQENLRRQKQDRWRERLSEMTREQLIELAVSGAEVVEISQEWIRDLQAQIAKQKADRIKGAIASRPDKKAAKEKIRARWTQAQLTQSDRFHEPTFAKRMQTDFEAITELKTIRRWCREWKKEWEHPQSQSPSQAAIESSEDPLTLLGLFFRLRESRNCASTNPLC